MSETIRTRVDQLNSMIQKGQIMEAMREFYADDVVMAENDAPPTVGLAANLEREQAFVDNTTWYGLELQNVAVGDDVSMVQWWMDFHNTQYGARLAFTQVAVQRWRDGKIVDERFYYTPQPVEAE
jgi:ketosteroid isomerase-like protein